MKKNLKKNADSLIEIEENADTFFRITSPDDDLTGSSVDGPVISRAEAAERFSVTVEELDDILEEHDMYYDDATNTTRFNGVCAIDNLEELAEYWKNGINLYEGDLQVVAFSGEIIGNCVDGDVVEPEAILHRAPVAVLRYFLE